MNVSLSRFSRRACLALALGLMAAGGVGSLQAQSGDMVSPGGGGGGAPAGGGGAPAGGAGGASGGGGGSSNGGGGSKTSSSGGNSFLGKDVPFVDLSNGIVMWDGKSWNITDNRAFRARFEKYLNAAEETDKTDSEYRAILDKILDLLAPTNVSYKSTEEAWGLLSKGAAFKQDARLCDSLADAVYTVWLSKQENVRVARAVKQLEEERTSLEWSQKLASEEKVAGEDQLRSTGNNADYTKAVSDKVKAGRDVVMQPYVTRLAEVNARLKLNQSKTDISELQAKIEFQALALQLFFQRRFQHVLIATRFYRSIFGDGDTLLRGNGEAQKLLTQASGLPPTLGVLDSLAGEAIRDVGEGVEAYNYLLEKKELQSATERLGETFAMGEFLPVMRTLSRDKKRQALEFTQKTNQLLSSLDVKDYERAERLVKELDSSAKDFDNSKPMAAIETARTISAMHLAKAKNAAVSGDRPTLETELKAATEIWPRNPALSEVSGLIFSQADVQQQALTDMDRLLAQKNYRQIMDERVRFIAAAALFPQKQAALAKVLEQMTAVDGTIIRATEVSKRGDYIGAWESVERVFQSLPSDVKLSQMRAELTTQAADFVRSLRRAQELEDSHQLGSSLAWYLKAQQMYPTSDFAREGIARLVKAVLPEDAAAEQGSSAPAATTTKATQTGGDGGTVN